MPRPSFFIARREPTKKVDFLISGSIDAQTICDFAHQHRNIRVLVSPTYAMPNGFYGVRALTAQEIIDRKSIWPLIRKFETARFNMSSTMASPTEPGEFPGDENPEYWTEQIFSQDKLPISVSFRDGDSGPDLGFFVFDKNKNIVEGQYPEGSDPILTQIRGLIIATASHSLVGCQPS